MMIVRLLGPIVAAFALAAGAWEGRAQIDPEKRRLIELGYNQSLEDDSPLMAYAFYYLNQPEFIRTNLTLRAAIAPVYFDGELGVTDALGPNTDVGIGVSGGGFGDSYYEIRRGDYLKSESFHGHGAGINSSVYHLFNPEARVPLHWVGRVGWDYSAFEPTDDTADGFDLPDDPHQLFLRTGFRYGGREPVLFPRVAMELSAWYQGRIRLRHGDYGFAGDRRLEASAHQIWGKGMLNYTFGEMSHYVSLSLTGGTAPDADRFSAFRLGGMLPFIAEFPLNIPGYFNEEISARNMAVLNAMYSLPIDPEGRWSIMASGGAAVVDYAEGFEQSGDWHPGLGGGLTYQSSAKTWKATAGYAYGFNAIRSDGRGGSSLGVWMEFDLEAAWAKRTGRYDSSLRPGNALRLLNNFFQWFR